MRRWRLPSTSRPPRPSQPRARRQQCQPGFRRLIHSIDDARAAHAAAELLLPVPVVLAPCRVDEPESPAATAARLELGNILLLCELAAAEGDAEVLADGIRDLEALQTDMRRALVDTALLDHETQLPSPSRCFVELQAAPGGGDTCYWLDRMLRMYTAWSQPPASPAAGAFRSALLASEPPFGNRKHTDHPPPAPDPQGDL